MYITTSDLKSHHKYRHNDTESHHKVIKAKKKQGKELDPISTGLSITFSFCNKEILTFCRQNKSVSAELKPSAIIKNQQSIKAPTCQALSMEKITSHIHNGPGRGTESV